MRILLIIAILFCFGCGSADQPFTMEMYQKIYPGQDMHEAITIMKSDGTPTATTAVPGFVCMGFMWQNPNGSNIQVLFMNGKVHTKAQAGLLQ
jgi:hypothetical protein